MSRSAQGPGSVVLLCRGCCCGTTDKHPQLDHEHQQSALQEAADGQPDVELRVVDCLDECDRSNVVVLRRPGRPARERDVWLGGLLSVRGTEALQQWIRGGAAGPLPDALAGLRFRHVPPRRGRARRG